MKEWTTVKVARWVGRQWTEGSRRRRILLAVFVLLLCLLALHAGCSWVTGQRLASTAEQVEERWGALNPRTLNPPKVLRGENRAVIVRAAYDLVALEKEDKVLLNNYLKLTGREPTAEETAAMKELLDRHRLAFEVLAEVPKRSASNWDVPYRQGAAAPIPKLLYFIELCKLNIARALVLLREGRTEEAAAAIELGLATTESFTLEPILIVQLIRISGDRLNALAIRELLARAEPSPDSLRRLMEASTRDPETDPIELGFIGEMKVMHKAILDYEGSTAQLGPHEPWIVRTRLVPWLLRPILRADRRFFLMQTDAMLVHHSVPRFRRDPDFATAKPKPWHIVSKVTLINYEGAIARGDQDVTRVALIRTALALRLHRLEHGAYPDSLAALAPAYLLEVPVDPFTGEPLEYRVDGDGFFLRSAGADVELPGRVGLEIDPVLEWSIPR